MATRTSIELHPDGCRVVEVVVRAGASQDAVVRTFVPAAADGSDGATVTEALARLRTAAKLQRRAWVTIWGLRSTQQLLRLPPARDEDLEALARREARKDIAALETGGEGATAVVVAGAEVQAGSQRRREVSLVAVSNADVRDQIHPIEAAGFVVEGVSTPALALAALARSREAGAPGRTAAYVAVGARATCLAIVRDGVLLFSREMAWGHVGTEGEAIDARMAAELKRSILYFKQTFRATVDSVVLCGDMPDLRGVTAPLADALGVPVEALDSLAGVDVASIPEPSATFREQVAALRIAIAAGADPEPDANLLPASIRAARAAGERRRRIVAAVVLGVALASGWLYAVLHGAGEVRRELSSLEEQVARVEAEARRADEAQRALAAAASRTNTLDALNTQGPRLARFLEAVARSAPAPLVVTSIETTADGPVWRVDVSGVATAEDPAASHATVSAFLERLSSSPYAGAPVRPPALRVIPASGHASAGAGVEFTVRFEVPR